MRNEELQILYATKMSDMRWSWECSRWVLYRIVRMSMDYSCSYRGVQELQGCWYSL